MSGQTRLKQVLGKNKRLKRKAWDLVHAQSRMLEAWAESDDQGKAELWSDLHHKGEALREELERLPRVNPTVETVRRTHSPNRAMTECLVCGEDWPCPTERSD